MEPISIKTHGSELMPPINDFCKLPIETFLHIIKHVSIEEAQRCLMTSKQLLTFEDKTYTYFAKKFRFTLQIDVSPKNCFLSAKNQFVTKFNRVMSSKSHCNYIIILMQNIKHLNPFKGNRLLQEVLRARDTFVFWNCLAFHLGVDNPLKNKGIVLSNPQQTEKTFGLDTIEEMLVWIMDFSKWCESNKAKLENVKELVLISRVFASLPKEVSYLVNLEIIYLDNKCLTDLPVEILELGKFKEILSISPISTSLVNLQDSVVGKLLQERGVKFS